MTLKRVFIYLLFAGIGLSLTGCQCASSQKQVVEKTDWLPRHKFQSYLAEKEKKNESGKNFWDLGYSVGKIEGKWEDGYQQYRINIVRSPNDTAFWWMWYFDMDKKFFQKKLSDLSVEGYQLISYTHNTTPTGDDSFGAVWHKKAEKK